MNRRQFLCFSAALSFAPNHARAQAKDIIKMRDLYEKDLSFSPLAQSLEGDRILVEGFMAPPLKADSLFFVLTKMPMAVCPFCEPDGEWPEDILAIYTKRRFDVVSFSRKINVEGKLLLDGYVDPETGFFSKVRLEDATFSRG